MTYAMATSFLALEEALDLLAARPEVLARGVKVEMPETLRKWIQTEKKLGNPALIEEVARTQDPALVQALAWSERINERIEEMVFGIPPFPFVRESLKKMQGKEHDLRQYVVEICGQEFGTKKQIMENAVKYAPDHSLMIGDAPGDYKAAYPNNALFFPINPGAEEASWERFYNEGLDRFFAGTFAGEYQQQLLDEFNTYLPTTPPWKK